MYTVRRIMRLALLGLTIATTPVLAQAGDPRPGPSQSAIPTVSVEFAGGTVGEYVASLKKAAGPGTPVNAILSDSASRMALAPISLKSVSVETALQAIEAAAGSADGVWLIGAIGQVMPDVLGGVAQAFSVDFRPNERMARGMSRRLVVYSMDEVTGAQGGVTPEVVLTAIESTLAMQTDPATKAELKYHKESGLLIVRGMAQDVEAVAQVLDRLGDDIRRRTRDASRAKSADILLRGNVQRAEIRVRVTREEVARAEQHLNETRAHVERGTASSAELRDAEGAVSHARAEFEMAMVELDQAQGQAQAAAAAPQDSPEISELKALIHQLQDEVKTLTQELEQARKGSPRR